ncbi:MAG: glycosyltransferase family 1 protein [bacterium]
MAIGLDVRILQESGAARGIATYIRGLLAGFESAGFAEQVVRFRYREPEPLGVVSAELGFAELHRVWREQRVLSDALNQLLLPVEVGCAEIDAFHAPSPYDLAWWYPVPLVVTIHDVAPLERPGGIVRTGLEHRFLYRFARRAARIITVSEFSRAAILRHLPLDPERLVVVPEAAQPGLAPASADAVAATLGRLGVRPPYVLHVGGYDRAEPRKDVATLIAAFAELRRREHDARLVLVGGGGAGVPDLVAAIERHGIGAHVVRTGFVSPPDLAALYTGASAFVFPSTYEGFGLPVLEAMTCGAPVLAARAGSLPEVGGDAALYAPPGDVASFAGTLAELLERGDLRRERIARGLARAAEFTWDRTARLTWDVYGAAIEEPAARLRRPRNWD